MKWLRVPRQIRIIAESRLPSSVLRRLNLVYWRRIFILNKDADGSKLRTDLYRTGTLRKNTRVEEDGVVTMDYMRHVEKKLGAEIIPFTEEELGLIEEALAEGMEGEIKERRIKWQV